MASETIHNLGPAPPVAAVDHWLRSNLGLAARRVGTSLEGRPILMYTLDCAAGSDARAVPTVLFLSLVHGNEPMGLFALLQAARFAVEDPPVDRPFRALFVPFVNIDAYELNVRFGRGCRRKNLRRTCPGAAAATLCPVGTHDGVDLNRNHPVDWHLDDEDVAKITAKLGAKRAAAAANASRAAAFDLNRCTFNYHGPQPWSEPEARAVRDVVWDHNVTAAISFHSQRFSFSPPLLIHPFTSKRPLDEMPVRDVARFRSWRAAMNPGGFYDAGTALEVINYAAGGSTIDWMYSAGVVPFVVEVTPPCNDRWCPFVKPRVIYERAERYGCTGRLLIDLATAGAVPEGGCAKGDWRRIGRAPVSDHMPLPYHDSLDGSLGAIPVVELQLFMVMPYAYAGLLLLALFSARKSMNGSQRSGN